MAKHRAVSPGRARRPERASSVASPLLAIAGLAAGHWPETAREAAVELSSPGSIRVEDSFSIQTVRAIKTVFDATGEDRISTADLIERLAEDEEGRSQDWWDTRDDKPAKGIGSKLAFFLKNYDIKPKTLRIGDKTPKGYEREAFEKAWSLYL